MKKGFTLIELLFVVILLLLIVGISIPIYMKVVDNTHKKIAIQNAEMIVENTFNSINLALANGEIINYPLKFNINGGKQVTSDNVTMKFKNELPDNGYIIVNSDLEVALALFDYEYCIVKEYDKNIEVLDIIDSAECINYIKNLY